MVAWGTKQRGAGEDPQGAAENFERETIFALINFIVVCSQIRVLTFYDFVHVKYMRCIACQFYFNKAVQRKKKTFSGRETETTNKEPVAIRVTTSQQNVLPSKKKRVQKKNGCLRREPAR